MALGKGLNQLFADADAYPDLSGDYAGSIEVPLERIDNDPGQPRKQFDEAKLEELAASIHQHGILQPLLVVPLGHDRYQLAAGERRFRAAKIAGLDRVPVVIRHLTDQERLEIGLIENLQREDLNPIEQAEALQRLMSRCGLTQEAAAERIGKSRSAVANIVRLLSLPDGVRSMVADGEISAGHARALIALGTPTAIEQGAVIVRESGLSVRETESMVQKQLEARKRQGAEETEQKAPRAARKLPAEVQEAQERISAALDTTVRISGSKKKGRILIEYASPEDLTRLFDLLTGPRPPEVF